MVLRREKCPIGQGSWYLETGEGGAAGAIAALRRGLDLGLTHIDTAETIAGFNDLKAEGKILAWGVSNFDVSDLQEVLELAGKGEITCNQVLYHLEERAIEHAVLPWCEENGVAFVAYSPFGHGHFPGPRSARGRLLEQLARRRGATPRQIALSFLVRRPSVFAIPKAGSKQHVAENARAGKIHLTDSEIAQIDRAFPLGSHPKHLPTL